MGTKSSRIYVVATLVVAGFVASAAIAQAIREHSWQPIWTIGWLPAVLVAALGPRPQMRGCMSGLRRRSGS